ncbi:hypothetical protein QBK99_11175 [Corticibacterium sp. UT-5YL-CI-8]|nr:hypothetical protein [Tianweitania sp. UT-5YL-CI-8]
MTPTRLQECLRALRWSDDTLAEAFGCDPDLVEAWILGFEPIPSKAAAWIETLARLHEAAEPEKPKSLKGKSYKP